jgi:hypothetical protein
MRISDSNIEMGSLHSEFSFTQRKESLNFWIGDKKPEISSAAADQLALSNESHNRIINDSKEKTNNIIESINTKMDDLSFDPDIMIIKFFMEELFGIDLSFIFDNIHGKEISNKNDTQNNENDGWGLEYDMEKTYFEKEYMKFNAKGIVNTADGKQISFEFGLEMSRSFVEKNELHIRAGNAVEKDPLVINYDGNAAELTDQKFSFDIDADGEEDGIPFVKQGSGFLVFDKNDDGKINDGKELFGAISGDGFSELEKYDSDKNDWIDENDPVYDNLGIWSKDQRGRDSIFSLRSKNIGAIYLGKAYTRFSLNNITDNTKLGRTISTGIYLNENGKPGTLQQINLFV